MADQRTEGQSEERIRFRDMMSKEEMRGSSEAGEKSALSQEGEERSPGGLRLAEIPEIGQTEGSGTDVSGVQAPANGPGEFDSDDQAIKALYNRIYQATCRVYEDAANRGAIDIAPMLPMAEALVETLTQPEPHQEDSEEQVPPPTFYREVMVATTASLDWPAHALHVATLAVKIGMGAGYSEEALKRLALAALVHDVGMVRMPSAILESSGKLTPQERSVIHTHPDQAAEIVDGLGEEYGWLKRVVEQEHERYRGQGYPHGLSGKEIDEFARIIGMVDTFVAMTQPRPWRPPLTPHEAAKELVYVRKDEFDPTFVKLFLKKISIFPLKSLVRLSNNEIGQVVVVHEDSPLRPTLLILQPPRHQQMAEEKVLDLRKRPLLYITGSVAEKDLAEFLQ